MVSVTFLEKALRTLEEAIVEYEKSPQNLLIRDGVIQRFEYSYELAIKTIQRMLKQTAISSNLMSDLTYKETIRLAAERGWLVSPESWFEYREARNKTSHAYSSTVASEVSQQIPLFLNSSKQLLSNLAEVEQ